MFVQMKRREKRSSLHCKSRSSCSRRLVNSRRKAIRFFKSNSSPICHFVDAAQAARDEEEFESEEEDDAGDETALGFFASSVCRC